MIVLRCSFCRFLRRSFFSSPDGEVTGQRSWISRRREPALSGEREARRCRYASHTIYRYALLELIYPGMLVAQMFTSCILAFKLTVDMFEVLPALCSVCFSLSIVRSRRYKLSQCANSFCLGSVYSSRLCIFKEVGRLGFVYTRTCFFCKPGTFWRLGVFDL